MLQITKRLLYFANKCVCKDKKKQNKETIIWSFL